MDKSRNSKNYFLLTFFRKISPSWFFLGFFCLFFHLFHLVHLWLINHQIKGHFHHEGVPIAARCTFMKIINGQRSFERSKKFSPWGQPKCRKVPKYFFWLNHLEQIVDLSSRNGPHGLGQSGQKLSAFNDGSKKVIRSPVGVVRKKLIFWIYGIMSDWMINNCFMSSCIWCSRRSSCSKLETA